MYISRVNEVKYPSHPINLQVSLRNLLSLPYTIVEYNSFGFTPYDKAQSRKQFFITRQ